MPAEEAAATSVDAALERMVCEVVGRLAPERCASARPDQELVNDLGYHSLALVELTFLLEEVFSLPQAQPADVAHIRTAGDVAAFIAGSIDRDAPLPAPERVAELLDDFTD